MYDAEYVNATHDDAEYDATHKSNDAKYDAKYDAIHAQHCEFTEEEKEAEGSQVGEPFESMTVF
jgi:hypothetical protein